MQTSKANVFTRPDTMFGVCEALGQDFRFNPNYLRVALALPLVWQPFVMIAVYGALGLLVLATRLLLPDPARTQAASAAPAAPVNDGPEQVPLDETLPLAA